MLEIDHIPVWTPDRDAALERLSATTGLPILEGFAPEGRRIARGVRFSNGPFLDVHQADADGPPFLGLSGEIAAAEALAARQGWRMRTAARRHEPDAAPWSILSFRRDQGVLTAMFVIGYAAEPEAWSSPIYNGGLYHRPADRGAGLRRVWLTARDTDQAGRQLEAMGFIADSEIRSSVAPFAGRIYRGGRADIVLAGGEDAVARVDIDGGGPPQVLQIGARLTAVIGDSASESQQG
jgi:hypothetical protein